jgi:hypothetical protein
LSVSHDYVAQRNLVDAVPEGSLRLTPAEAQAGFRWVPAATQPAATA